jgi:hypothetical protein
MRLFVSVLPVHPVHLPYTKSPEPFIFTLLPHLSFHLPNVTRFKATKTDTKFVVYVL